MSIQATFKKSFASGYESAENSSISMTQSLLKAETFTKQIKEQGTLDFYWALGKDEQLHKKKRKSFKDKYGLIS